MSRLEKIVNLKLNNFEVITPKEEMEKYPWDECIADQMERYGDEETAKKICGAIKAGMQKTFAEGDSLENACWPGYQAVGLKDVDGRMVPNCVPIEAAKEEFVIPAPSGSETEDDYIGRCISAIASEYPEEGQPYAICKSKWDEK